MPEIEGLDILAVPQSFNTSVQALMEVKRRRQCDLTVQSANIRANEADVQNAQSQFYPVAGLSAGYGENNWKSPPNAVLRTRQPQYLALLSLGWDILPALSASTNCVRHWPHTRASNAVFEQVQVDALAQVWRAYFDFRSSLTRYEWAQS
jgi:outer membrane protein TolC